MALAEWQGWAVFYGIRAQQRELAMEQAKGG
jgi:hypothetical protein